jgi:hypothetical protein
MTYDEALQKFGLPANPQDREEIRHLLMEETELAIKWEDREEMLRTLTLQLFSIGMVDDSILIWKAKQSSFDASCTVDIQFICGAGLGVTKEYLAKSTDALAPEALDYLSECEQSGDFDGWTPQSSINSYRKYYELG